MWYMCTSDIRWQSASEVPPQMFVTMLAKKSPKGHHEKHVPKNYYFISTSTSATDVSLYLKSPHRYTF